MNLQIKFTVVPTPGPVFHKLRLTLTDSQGNHGAGPVDIPATALQNLQLGEDGKYTHTVSGVNGLAAGQGFAVAQPMDVNEQPIGDPSEPLPFVVPLSEGGWIPVVASVS